MTSKSISVIGQDGERYEIIPTDALLSFLQRMAEGETEGQGASNSTSNQREFAIIEKRRISTVI